MRQQFIILRVRNQRLSYCALESPVISIADETRIVPLPTQLLLDAIN